MSALPIYKQLYSDLKHKIHQGNFEKGDLLPSENELCQEYHTTRATVRQGLNVLVQEGYIEKRMGLGSVVVNNRSSLGLLTFKGFTEVLANTVLSSRTHVLGVTENASWPDPFFYDLNEKERAAGCLGVERLRLVEDVPLMLESTYLPNKNLPGFAERFEAGSLFGYLASAHQIMIEGVEQDIRAVNPDHALSNILQLTPGTPVLQVFRKYQTSRKDFFLYSCLHCDTTRYTISNLFN